MCLKFSNFDAVMTPLNDPTPHPLGPTLPPTLALFLTVYIFFQSSSIFFLSAPKQPSGASIQTANNGSNERHLYRSIILLSVSLWNTLIGRIFFFLIVFREPTLDWIDWISWKWNLKSKHLIQHIWRCNLWQVIGLHISCHTNPLSSQSPSFSFVFSFSFC